MLLSRFWYVVLSLALGASLFCLFMARQLYNRAGYRAMSEALAADSSAVEWFLKDDARRRASALIPISLNPELRGQLAKATSEQPPSREVKEKARVTLRKLSDEISADLKFDVVWAVDANGRVIAAMGFEHGVDDWDMGGYPVVADALHGWIRDDAWVWKGRIYRIVARPVEQEVNGEPVGAVVGAKIVDDTFARSVTKRTGAAVGFYAEGARVASGAPEGFDKANLDQITQDLKYLEENADYQEKGRSEVRVIGEHLGVVYARMPGEAWDLGAGYAVGRLAVAVDTPFDFLNKADNTDKAKVPLLFIVLGIVGAAILGLFFSVLEHTMPLGTFRKEVARLAKGEIDVFQPSRFRGLYKKLASDLNDGMEKVAAKGGVPRKAADLEQVLGPIPTQPTMSAFSVPGPGESTMPSPAASSGPKLMKPLPRASKKEKSSGESSGMKPSPVSDLKNDPMADLFGPSEPTAPPPKKEPPAKAAPAPEEATTEAPTVASPARIEPEPAPVAAKEPEPEATTKAMPPAKAVPAAAAPKAPAPAAKPAVAAPAAKPAVAAAAAKPAAPKPPELPPTVTEGSVAMAMPAPEGASEEEEWKKTYDEFLAMKKQCGEPTSGLTFDKFKVTLQRNKDALISRHGVTRVRFTVYVKDGKAALKASPVK